MVLVWNRRNPKKKNQEKPKLSQLLKAQTQEDLSPTKLARQI